MNEKCRFASVNLVMPGDQLRLIGMGRKAIDRMDTSTDGYSFAEQHHVSSAIDDLACKGTLCGEPDEDDDGLGAPQVVPQVMPDPAERQKLLDRLAVKDFSYADRRLREFGASNKMAVTTLGPALGAYAAGRGVYLNGFGERNWGMGHWNETGHRLAGEVIAEDLCRRRIEATEADPQ